MKLVLDIKTPTITQKLVIKLGDSITVGRNKKSQYIVKDELVSSIHATLSLNENGLEISDSGSKNGTFLNNLKIDTARVFLNDNLKLGQTFIIINHNESTPDAIDLVTYKGDRKNRTAYGLKLDFESIGKQAQGTLPTIGETTLVMEMRRIKQRKYSKKELRQKHKALASFASTLDLIFSLVIVVCALIVSYGLIIFVPEFLRGHKTIFTFVTLIGSYFIFYYFNFKKSSFTIGEKIVGIRDMYLKQD